MTEYDKKQEWKHQIEACKDGAVNMTEWEETFIKSLFDRLCLAVLKGDMLNLSDKQSLILDRIYTERVP